MNLEFAECPVSSPCQEWFFLDGHACHKRSSRMAASVSFRERTASLSSDVARADSDRQTSVVEPDLQTVRAHIIVHASTLMTSSFRRLVVTLLIRMFCDQMIPVFDTKLVRLDAMKLPRN